ncbi:hypothetical protein AB0E88_16370 [Streptomyces sp. NPDC028635]|uniref:hypothetical protein n=1 Tax=Streptomyces sp. NPDC028635 TaxID=3154800 RepID=UPI0033D0CC37
MPAAETPEPQPRPAVRPGLSMRDLLASCAAAAELSRPPRDPEPAVPAPERSKAA